MTHSLISPMHKVFPILLLILVACLPPAEAGSTPAPPPEHPWGAALRTLDPAEAAEPAYDLTAVYLRQEGAFLQVRVDLLDFQAPRDLALDILIQDDTSPEADSIAVRLPDDADSESVTIDPALDSVTARFPLGDLPARFHVDVATPEDQIRDLKPDGPTITQTTPLLLTFYDTFAARFPAEALRSWDGAHSGPLGERHGLKHLLDAVETYQVPITLLDLRAPETLSALDALGALPRVQRLAEEGLLLLPQTTDKTNFILPPSETGYSPKGGGEAGPAYRFIFTQDASHLHRWTRFPFQTVTCLPVASQPPEDQPTPEGPGPEVRRALLETALNDDPDDLLVLGGSLAGSTWGASNMPGPTLAYFASRPYIRVLSEADLLDFPTREGAPETSPPPVDESLSELEAHYAGLSTPVMEFAQDWQGASHSTCGEDRDRDGQPECTLANENLLAVLDPEGARLTYLFARDEAGPRQLTGPSWGVAVGLSDPALWRFDLGEAADPGAYPGAFTERDDPFTPYQPSIDGDRIVFASGDGAHIKTFRLTGGGLEVIYQFQSPATTQIPLLVDPLARFSPGWAGKYILETTPDGVRWGLRDGPMVDLGAEGPLSARAFNESLDLLSGPEDPDYEYPPGHYVPFPMAVVEARVAGEYHFILTVE